VIEDPVSEHRLSLVHPDIQKRWLGVRDEFYKDHGLQIRVTSGYRNFTEQMGLYALGRARLPSGVWEVVDMRKKVTDARGGESYHNFGLAVDSAFMGDDPYLSKMPTPESDILWANFGKIGKSWGFEWGGDWQKKKLDRPHLQKKFDLSLHECQIIYEDKGLKGIFERCNAVMACGRAIV
jgi:peptidoglycan L-alanyl-D-glutamate endopeptidase CwlK